MLDPFPQMSSFVSRPFFSLNSQDQFTLFQPDNCR